MLSRDEIRASLPIACKLPLLARASFRCAAKFGRYWTKADTRDGEIKLKAVVRA